MKSALFALLFNCAGLEKLVCADSGDFVLQSSGDRIVGHPMVSREECA